MFELSKWKYLSSRTNGVAAGYYAASGGSLHLLSPTEEIISFTYAGGGLGIGCGVKSGRMKVELPVSLVHGEPDWIAYGAILIGPDASAKELSKPDFMGPCAFIDGGAGIIEGINVDIICCNIDQKTLKESLIGALVPAANIFNMIRNSNAVILCAAESRGLQAGAGISINAGMIW